MSLQSYICSLEVDVATCLQQNTHGRTEAHLEAISAAWETCPKEQLRLDINPLIEWSRISEIPVEDISNDELEEESEDEIPLVERKATLVKEDIPLSESVKTMATKEAPKTEAETTEIVEEEGDKVADVGDVKEVEGIVQTSQEVEELGSAAASEVKEANKEPENEMSTDKLEKVDDDEVVQVNEEIGVSMDEGKSLVVSNEEVPELDGEPDWNKDVSLN